MAEFRAHLETVMKGGSLGRAGAREAMNFLTSGEAGDVQIASFLAALNARPPAALELAGFAEAMRERALRVEMPDGPLVDTCGTGGDGLGSFNFSTAAALVAAGAGAKVAKHGNRAVSSRSGSADLLEALGVAVDAPPEAVRRSVEEAGFGFFFAPRYHPAMKHVAHVRKAMGVRTVFNLLGPLCNPAMLRRQVVGIYDGALMETYAGVLAALGAERAMAVHGLDGMDEMSLTGPTLVVYVENGAVTSKEVLEPEDAGLRPVPAEALKGGDAAENARRLEAMLEGKETGPLLEATLFNAGAALFVAGLAASLREGVEAARESASSGKAAGVLWKLRTLAKGTAS